MKHVLLTLSPLLILAEAPKQPGMPEKPPEVEKAPAETTHRRRVVMPDGRVMDLWYDEESKSVVSEPKQNP
jgi:hypothetical protein